MKYNILITGASGFLGLNLIKILSQKKYNLIIVSRNSKKKVFQNKYFNKLRVINNSIKDLEKIKIKLRIDGIIHLATCYGRNGENKENIYNTNYSLPISIYEIFKSENLKFFINADTYFNSSINFSIGLNHYVNSKKKLIQSLNRKNTNTKVVNCIIHHMYGENDSSKKFIPYLVNNFKKDQIINLTKGNQKKDFIHVIDVAEAFKLILDNSIKSNESNEVFEIGSGKSYSIRYIVYSLKKILKSKSKVNFGILKNRVNEKIIEKADNKNLKKIGWKQKITLLEGLSFFR